MTGKNKVGARVALLVSSAAACAAANAAAPATITIPGERLLHGKPHVREGWHGDRRQRHGPHDLPREAGRGDGAKPGFSRAQKGSTGVFGVFADDKSNTL